MRATPTRCSTASRLGPKGLHAYFVHSYQLDAAQTTTIWSPTPTMAGRSPRSSARDNMVGTQFHPEKSQKLGLGADRQFPEVEAVILFPAIDLKDGQCVRLQQGDMARATVFNGDPAAQARAFDDAGLRMAASSSISTAPSPASR